MKALADLCVYKTNERAAVPDKGGLGLGAPQSPWGAVMLLLT